MNRRNFLKLLSAAAPVAAAAPTYFFAPIGGWHQTKVGVYIPGAGRTTATIEEVIAWRSWMFDSGMQLLLYKNGEKLWPGLDYRVEGSVITPREPLRRGDILESETTNIWDYNLAEGYGRPWPV